MTALFITQCVNLAIEIKGLMTKLAATRDRINEFTLEHIYRRRRALLRENYIEVQPYHVYIFY